MNVLLAPCAAHVQNSLHDDIFFFNLPEQKQVLTFPLSKGAFPLVRGKEEN